jgi:TRAP-type C4-dicarboxylate transport system substrate-binding protein
MNRNKRVKTILMLMLAMILVTGCGQSQSTEEASSDSGKGNEAAAGQEELTIRVAHNLPEEHPVGVYFNVFVEEIEKNTAETSIKIVPQLFANGVLYNDTQLPDALSTGGLEIGAINPTMVDSSQAPLLKVWDLPFLFESWEASWAAKDGEFGQIIGEQLSNLNSTLLGFAAYGTVELYGNEPIQVPEDIKGKKMRALGQAAAVWLQEVGASPVTISSQELYQAMSQGVVDGYMTGPSSVIERSLFEVTSYGTSNLTILHTDFPVIANTDWWNGLPEDVQQAILAASETATQASRDKLLELEEQYIQELTDGGIELISVSDEDKQRWVKTAEKRYEELINSDPKGQQLIDLAREANEQNRAQ